MWEFHYTECGDFIKQNVGISLCRLCFSGIKPQCISLKKAKAMIYNQAQNIILGISRIVSWSKTLNMQVFNSC